LSYKDVWKIYLKNFFPDKWETFLMNFSLFLPVSPSRRVTVVQHNCHVDGQWKGSRQAREPAQIHQFHDFWCSFWLCESSLVSRIVHIRLLSSSLVKRNDLRTQRLCEKTSAFFYAQICVDRSWLWLRVMKWMTLSDCGGLSTCSSIAERALTSPWCNKLYA
jgi:intracellular sulfur oxidation DsrE/DsrF family protein